MVQAPLEISNRPEMDPLAPAGMVIVGLGDSEQVPLPVVMVPAILRFGPTVSAQLFKSHSALFLIVTLAVSAISRFARLRRMVEEVPSPTTISAAMAVAKGTPS